MRFLPALAVAALTATAAAPAMADRDAADDGAPTEITVPAEPKTDYEALKLLGSTVQRIRQTYIEEVSTRELVEAAIRGMTDSLDPHTAYHPPERAKRVEEKVEGRFGGVGVRIEPADNGIRVVSAISDTPAARAGVQARDLIVGIDDTDARGLDLKQAVELMRGEVGEPITLTIERAGTPDPLEITVERDSIEIEVVDARRIHDVGVLEVTSFNRHTVADLRAAVEKMSQNTAPAAGWILDLRGNPGGLLGASVDMADMFLDSGTIVQTRGRDGQTLQTDRATSGDITGGAPLIVLVDGGSASASEIVAGALQDQGRALVMGTRTFGKGSVQTVADLGDAGLMTITTARYYTPSGRSIQARGIAPDILVPAAKVEIDKTARKREADLEGALTAEDDDSATSDAAPDDLFARDNQLDRAVDMLMGSHRLNSLARTD